MDKRLIEAIGSGDLVLDLGCGSGDILKDLSGRFERRIGVDISRRRLNEMAGGEIDGWEFREADLNRPFPLESEIADAVVANQVIEHIIDPAGFVREIHRILLPYGHTIWFRDPGKLIDFPSQIVHGSTVRFEGEPCSG